MIDSKKFFKSVRHALEGIHYALNSDQNLIIHFFAAVIVILVAVLLQVTPFEMGILGVTILVVISAEMVNTALEKMVDLITKEHRAEAKIAKDISAGMVLISSVGASVIGFLIFLPYILRLFR